MRTSERLMRTLSQNRGALVVGAAWILAAGTCLTVLAWPRNTPRVAVAVVRAHDVRVPESGRVASVDVAPGQKVDVGAVLATVEIPGVARRVVLKAHVAGIVGDVVPDAGTWVQAGVPALTVVEPGAKSAVAWVNVSEARRLALGDRVHGRDGEGHAVEAAVREIGLAARGVGAAASDAADIPVTLEVLDRALAPGDAFSVEF